MAWAIDNINGCLLLHSAVLHGKVGPISPVAKPFMTNNSWKCQQLVLIEATYISKCNFSDVFRHPMHLIRWYQRCSFKIWPYILLSTSILYSSMACIKNKSGTHVCIKVDRSVSMHFIDVCTQARFYTCKQCSSSIKPLWKVFTLQLLTLLHAIDVLSIIAFTLLSLQTSPVKCDNPLDAFFPL